MLPRASRDLVDWANSVRDGERISDDTLSIEDRKTLREYYYVARRMFGWQTSPDDAAFLILWKSKPWWRRMFAFDTPWPQGSSDA